MYNTLLFIYYNSSTRVFCGRKPCSHLCHKTIMWLSTVHYFCMIWVFFFAIPALIALILGNWLYACSLDWSLLFLAFSVLLKEPGLYTY